MSRVEAYRNNIIRHSRIVGLRHSFFLGGLNIFARDENHNCAPISSHSYTLATKGLLQKGLRLKVLAGVQKKA